jgi:hypothetical protein
LQSHSQQVLKIASKSDKRKSVFVLVRLKQRWAKNVAFF